MCKISMFLATHLRRSRQGILSKHKLPADQLICKMLSRTCTQGMESLNEPAYLSQVSCCCVEHLACIER